VNGLFNLGTGQSATYLALAQAVAAAAGRQAAVEFIDMPAALAGQYQYHTEAPMQRLRAAGYARPFLPVAEGVRRYVQEFLRTDDPYR
jgi:ADP-L-glycero-D-manno-heptose 6-epimerase